jgi:cytochrome c oxidase assembly protein subunit 15
VQLSRLIARIPYPSQRQQVAVGVAAIVTQATIGVTGSVVRVTGSGLGCSTWPGCHAGTMFPQPHPEYAALTQWIEFGNRLLTFLVGLVAVAAVLAAWRVHQETGGRRRLLTLALMVLGGTGLQGVLGGITVLAGLLWWTVALHFLVSAVLIWVAVLLARAFREGDEPPRLLVSPTTRTLLGLLTGSLATVLVAGTMVTGAGPHGGDPDTPRLAWSIDVLATVHAVLLVVFLVVLALVGVSLLRSPAPKTFTRRYLLLWLVALAQGGLGSLQYQLGVPEGLVSLHVLGAALVVIATAALWISARDRGPSPQPPVTEPAAARAEADAAAA